MTVKGFVFLMIVTIASVMVAGTVAESFTREGFERTIVVAVLTALVVFPAAKWAERKGWVKGSVRIDELGKEFGRQKPAPKGGRQAPAATPQAGQSTSNQADPAADASKKDA